MSDDDVVQWCVEEALMERLEHHERKQDADAARDQAVKDAQRRVHDANERRRAAEGGR